MRFRNLSVCALALLLLSAVPLTAQESTPEPSDYRVVGYFTSWGIYGRQYFVTDIPADQVTHINYAFARISEDGEVMLSDNWADVDFPYPTDTDSDPLKGNFHQLQLLKAAHPNLQTLISIGGWTYSGRFSNVALTAESRAKFAKSVVDFVVQYGFDGADIDWEYPTGNGMQGNVERAEDKENYVLLLQELRSQLDAQGAKDGHHYLLTIAASAGSSYYNALDWSRIVPALDWINVMAYDMSGSWSSVTGHNAPLYNSTAHPPEGTSVNTTMQAYLALGIPSNKLVLGVPFYGRGWSGVADVNNGLHQRYDGLPQGTWEEGAFDYGDLADNYVPTMTRFWDDAAQVPWLFDADKGVMISYDDPESMALKAQYVVDNGLGGVMFWEFTQDSDNYDLLGTVNRVLSGE